MNVDLDPYIKKQKALNLDEWWYGIVVATGNVMQIGQPCWKWWLVHKYGKQIPLFTIAILYVCMCKFSIHIGMVLYCLLLWQC